MLPLVPFYYVRHGESEANAANLTAGGSSDSPLTDCGRRQAKEVGHCLREQGVQIGTICHSTMKRAAETAHIIGNILDGDISMVPIKLLEEQHLGDWEMAPWDEVLPQIEAGVEPPRGETYATFIQRIGRAGQESLSYPGPILMVAHGGVWHALAGLYKHAAKPIHNCNLFRFDPVEGNAVLPWSVTLINDGINDGTGPLIRTDHVTQPLWLQNVGDEEEIGTY